MEKRSDDNKMSFVLSKVKNISIPDNSGIIELDSQFEFFEVVRYFQYHIFKRYQLVYILNDTNIYYCPDSGYVYIYAKKQNEVLQFSESKKLLDERDLKK